MGHRSVAEAQRSIDSREFAEWLAYDRISPIGPERADWRAAMLAATLANVWRGKGAPLAIADFLPVFDKIPRRRDPREMEAEMMAWARRHNEVVRWREAKRERDRD